MDTDAYLLCCCRYVERNPVKAGMVKKAEDYAWSSARARLEVEHCTWLDEPPTFLELGSDEASQVKAYRRFLSDTSVSAEDKVISAAIQSNQLTGGAKFIEEIERHTGFRIEARGRGRPKSGCKE